MSSNAHGVTSIAPWLICVVGLVGAVGIFGLGVLIGYSMRGQN